MLPHLPVRAAAIACTLTILATVPVAADLLAELSAAAPEADPNVIALALEARDCAGGASAAKRLAVIDFSRPSTEPRLWVFDLERRTRLYAEHVAHGQGSGDNYARLFSNRKGSHQSSLGLFRAAETYHGRHGYSLRLDGLEPGVNDRARERDIVMHGADYADPSFAERHGRLGRSWGCPAVRRAVSREIIDTLQGGQLLFAYYPDSRWMASSPYLGCAERRAQGESATAAAGSAR